jgi:nitrile hydratase accessory protein
LSLSDFDTIRREGDGPVFAELWQAQVFALALQLHERGVFTWAEWSTALANEIKDRGGEYYECWLAALEALMERKGLMTQRERETRIDEWDRAAQATPHGQPIVLSRAG